MDERAEPTTAEVAPADPQLPAVVTRVDGFIAAAIAQQLPIETMERLFALYQQQQADDARRLFFEALTRFQSTVPAIVKDKDVSYGEGATAYRYATLTHIVNTIKEPLAACGLSFRFEQEDIEGGSIRVTCIATHVAGHSERTSMSGPADTSGKKNAIQSRGSSNSYLKRYTLGGVFGLVIDEDDDGRASPPKKAQKPKKPPCKADDWLKDKPPAEGDRKASELVIDTKKQILGKLTAVEKRPWTKGKDDQAATGWMEFEGLVGRIYTASLPEKNGFVVGDVLEGIVFKAAESGKGNPYASAHTVRKVEEEANDLNQDSATDAAGPQSVSADPPPSREHTPKTGDDELTFWHFRVKDAVRRLPPGCKVTVPEGWEQWTSTGELERLDIRLREYLPEEPEEE